MYAVGHLAIGYLSGKAMSKLAQVDVNVPLLFVLSIIPDIDLLIPGLEHRGPTHSIIILCLLFLPSFMFYRKKAAPYITALILHTLADGLTGGAQLLWPLSTNDYGMRIGITSLANILTEWIFFLLSSVILFKTEDMQTLFKPHQSNLFLLIPIFTVLAPTFFMFPSYVPLELVIPHLIYLTIFTISILVDIKPKRRCVSVR